MMKVLLNITAVCVCVCVIMVALVLSAVSGTVLAEDSQRRRDNTERMKSTQEYVDKNCKVVSRVDDPTHTGSIKRVLYQCPAYRMIVI